MKFSNLRAFAKHLSEAAPNHFAPVYLISASDDGERKEAVQNFISALFGKAPQQHALKVIEGEKTSVSELMGELQANTFFAPRRIIHLRLTDKLNESIATSLEGYFSNPNPKAFLLISATAMNRGSRFYKQVEKTGIILDIEEQKPWEKAASLSQFAMQKLSQAGITADQQLCKLLAERTGQQMLLEQEIEKLITYLGDRRQLTMADIETLCIRTSNETGWQLGDAIFRKDTAGALRMVRSLLEQEGSLIPIARQLRSQFQTKCQICALIVSGQGTEEVQKRFPYMRGNILQQNVQAAKDFGLEKLMKGLMSIDEIELQTKSSSAPEELLAEQLIFKLTI